MTTSTLDLTITRDAECTTRDGTILRADIYHNPDSEPQPVLVCRTPYNKLLSRYQEHAIDIAKGGYTVVVQDMRGRYASDGEYFWMWRDKHETTDIQDGYDTIEWAAKLPQSDGQRRHLGPLQRLVGDLDDPSLKSAQPRRRSRVWHLHEHA